MEDLLSTGLSLTDFPFIAPPDAILASARDATDATKKATKVRAHGRGRLVGGALRGATVH